MINNKYQKVAGRFLVAFFCLLLWQGCFKFRTPDAEAIEAYGKKKVDLTIRDFEYSEKRKIHYLQTGKTDAPTIYFIHGTPGSSNNFDSYLQDSALRNEYRLISIDRPGFGYSNFGKAEPMELQVEMIEALIQKNNNGKPVILVGHSLGGPIVAAIGARNMPPVRVLLIWAGSISPELEPKEAWRKPLSSGLLRWAVPGAFRPSNDEMVDFKTYVLKMPELLSQIKMPVYLAHGTKDMLVPFENMAYTAEKLTASSSVNTIAMERENHFIPWTRFTDLRDLLLYIRPQIQ